MLTIGFAVVTINRLTMDYNENGVYFDDNVTYDTDAIMAYGIITGTLLLLTVGLMIVWRKAPSHQQNA